MADKLLYENLMTEEEAQVEPAAGNSGDSLPSEFAKAAGTSAAEPGTAVYGANINNTNTSDIARTAPKVGFANSVASRTLPATLGYVQPMSSPSGFVFAMKRGPATNQDSLAPSLHGDVDSLQTGPTAGTAGPEDLQITRTSVNTGIREVLIDCTNELTQDVQRLFGSNFQDMYRDFLYYDGTDIDMENSFEVDANWDKESTDMPLAKFFMEYATWRMSRKTNTDFISWVDGVATDLGTFAVADAASISTLKLAVGEMKSKLYESTGKTGRTWVLAGPATINYLLLDKTTCAPDNKMTRKGKRIATSEDYNYVYSCGEIDYYQDVNLVGGEIYAGLAGGAGVASVYYTPYKEYFVQGGEDYQTGQSNIWFRTRDAWVTNPLDDGTGAGNNDSDYIVKSTVSYTFTSIIQ